MTTQQDYQTRMTLETDIITFLSEEWNVTPIRTTQSRFCPVDCILTKNDNFVAICEVRTRRDKWDDVQRWGGMFLNYIKLNNAIEMSRQFCVPFLFVAYFIPDDILMYWKVTNDKGQIQIEMTLTSRNAQDNIADGKDVKRIRNVVMLPNNPKVINNAVIK